MSQVAVESRSTLHRRGSWWRSFFANLLLAAGPLLIIVAVRAAGGVSGWSLLSTVDLALAMLVLAASAIGESARDSDFDASALYYWLIVILLVVVAGALGAPKPSPPSSELMVEEVLETVRSVPDWGSFSDSTRSDLKLAVQDGIAAGLARPEAPALSYLRLGTVLLSLIIVLMSAAAWRPKKTLRP